MRDLLRGQSNEDKKSDSQTASQGSVERDDFLAKGGDDSSSLSSSELGAKDKLEDTVHTCPTAKARMSSSEAQNNTTGALETALAEQLVPRASTPEIADEDATAGERNRRGGSPSAQARIRRKQNRSKAAAATAAKSFATRPQGISGGKAPYPPFQTLASSSNGVASPGAFPTTDAPGHVTRPTPVPVSGTDPAHMWGYYSPFPPPGNPSAQFPAAEVKGAWEYHGARPHWPHSTTDMAVEKNFSPQALQVATQKLLGMDKWKSLKEQMVSQQLELTQQIAALRSCSRTQKVLVAAEKTSLSEEYHSRNVSSIIADEEMSYMPQQPGSRGSGGLRKASTSLSEPPSHKKSASSTLLQNAKRVPEESTNNERPTLHSFGTSSAFTRPRSSGDLVATSASTTSRPHLERPWFPGQLSAAGEELRSATFGSPTNPHPPTHSLSTATPSFNWCHQPEGQTWTSDSGSKLKDPKRVSLPQSTRDKVPGHKTRRKGTLARAVDSSSSSPRKGRGSELNHSKGGKDVSKEALDFLPNYPYCPRKQHKPATQTTQKLQDHGNILHSTEEKSSRNGVVIPKPKGATEQSAADILLSLTKVR